MTHTEELAAMAEQESPIFRESRELSRHYQRGLLSAAEYQEHFQALDRAAGVLCRCGRGIRTVKSASGAICAQCYLEGRR